VVHTVGHVFNGKKTSIQTNELALAANWAIAMEKEIWVELSVKLRYVALEKENLKHALNVLTILVKLWHHFTVRMAQNIYSIEDKLNSSETMGMKNLLN
jgi:hypothetical protein